MSKNEKVNTSNEGAGEATTLPTIIKTIAGQDIALPIRFVAGHVLSDTEAKVINAAYQRQFKNNKDAAFKAWEAKQAKAAEKGEAFTLPNPCTAEALLADFATYHPEVGADEMSALEKARLEAGERAMHEMVKEHNASFAASGSGPLGKGHFAIPKGKGSKEAKDALIQRVLGSAKQAERVQRHLDAVLAERKEKAKAEPAANVPTVGFADADI